MEKKELIEQAKALLKYAQEHPAEVQELLKSQPKSGLKVLHNAMKKDSMAMAQPTGIRPEGARGAKQTTHDGPTGGNESAVGKQEIKADAKRPKLSDAQRAGPSSQSEAKKIEIKPEGPRGAKQTTHDGPTGGNESAMGKREMIKKELKEDWKPKWQKEKKCE